MPNRAGAIGRRLMLLVKPTLIIYVLVLMSGRAPAAETTGETDFSTEFGSYSLLDAPLARLPGPFFPG
jgi:hypothetical protein